MNKKDIVVIISIATISLMLFIGVKLFNMDKQIEYGAVSLNNEVILKFDINVDDIYEFSGAYGDLKLEVKDQKYRIFDEECPNHICSSMGFIGKDDFLPIVCIPNNIMISMMESN